LTSDRILCAATCIGDHIMFENLEPPEEGKSIEFPRKHAILADCTTIDYFESHNNSLQGGEDP